MSPAPQFHWFIAGLGNPGPQYELTPHNIGFLVIDHFAARHQIRLTRQEANALVGVGRCGAASLLLAKPQTFMNLSGPSVRLLMQKYGLQPAQLLLVYDELALPWTHLRIRPRGSSAGHNGVESVIRSLGTQDFPRLRLGIHPSHPLKDSAKFVLTPFRRAQYKELDEVVELAAQAIEFIIAEGVEKAMAKFNRRAQSVSEEEQ